MATLQPPSVYVCVIDGEYAMTATVHLTRIGALNAANNPDVFKHGPNEALDPDDYDDEEEFENALADWYNEHGNLNQYFEIIKTQIKE